MEKGIYNVNSSILKVFKHPFSHWTHFKQYLFRGTFAIAEKIRWPSTVQMTGSLLCKNTCWKHSILCIKYFWEGSHYFIPEEFSYNLHRISKSEREISMPGSFKVTSGSGQQLTCLLLYQFLPQSRHYYCCRCLYCYRHIMLTDQLSFLQMQRKHHHMGIISYKLG